MIMLICQTDSRIAQSYPICAKKRLDLSASAKSNHQPDWPTKVQSEGGDMRTRDLDEAIDAVAVTDVVEEIPVLVPGLIRRAERFMADNAATPITVSDVAAHLGDKPAVTTGGIPPVACHDTECVPQAGQIAAGA
jgi:hypothetical protein